MNGDAFDRLSRRMGAATSRRGLLRAFFSGLAGLACAGFRAESLSAIRASQNSGQCQTGQVSCGPACCSPCSSAGTCPTDYVCSPDGACEYFAYSHTPQSCPEGQAPCYADATGLFFGCCPAASCPDGQVACGASTCCPAGTTCAVGNPCCPTDQACLISPTVTVCCDSGGTCWPWAGEGTSGGCCPAGTVWCNGACCSAEVCIQGNNSCAGGGGGGAGACNPGQGVDSGCCLFALSTWTLCLAACIGLDDPFCISICNQARSVDYNVCAQAGCNCEVAPSPSAPSSTRETPAEAPTQTATPGPRPIEPITTPTAGPRPSATPSPRPEAPRDQR